MLFVDTSFLAGLALASDSSHAAALRLLDRFETEPVCTSELVLGETWTLLRKRSGHQDALSWIDRVRAAPKIRVEQVDEKLISEAWSWLRVHDERAYSFVDATSFALMRRLHITDALTFDVDFGVAGFVALRPE